MPLSSSLVFEVWGACSRHACPPPWAPQLRGWVLASIIGLACTRGPHPPVGIRGTACVYLCATATDISAGNSRSGIFKHSTSKSEAPRRACSSFRSTPLTGHGAEARRPAQGAACPGEPARSRPRSGKSLAWGRTQRVFPSAPSDRSRRPSASALALAAGVSLAPGGSWGHVLRAAWEVTPKMFMVPLSSARLVAAGGWRFFG